MTIVEDRPNAGYDAARRAMINSQLRTSGVNADFVLRRMRDVPREDFVPAALRPAAYVDRAVPLGEGRFLPAPVVQGMMLQEAAPTAKDSALVVDGGSGYLAELLHPLVGSLDVIAAQAATRADPERGPYSLILIDGAAGRVPDSIAGWLAADGRLLTGLIEDGISRLALGRRSGDGLAFLTLGEMGIPALGDFAATKGWTF